LKSQPKQAKVYIVVDTDFAETVDRVDTYILDRGATYIVGAVLKNLGHDVSTLACLDATLDVHAAKTVKRLDLSTRNLSVLGPCFYTGTGSFYRTLPTVKFSKLHVKRLRSKLMPALAHRMNRDLRA